MEKYLITATLLNAWKYYTESEYGDKESFMATLTRQPEEDKECFIEGRRFEDWAVKNYEPTLNGVYQLKAYKDWDKYLLYGKIDCLKAGVIYDYKRSKTYEVGGYLNSPQTAMYLELIPEARKFTYLIYKGSLETDDEDIKNNILAETYLRDEVIPIQQTIKDFERWLKAVDLWQVYTKHWGALQ